MFSASRDDSNRSAEERLLVIDTTTDYIDFICRRYPGQALFVTDPARRRDAREPAPDTRSELLVEMAEPGPVLESVRQHLEHYGIKAAGITCFDCEALWLTALLAREFGLPFPSERAVLTSRNKYLSKRLWQQAGLDCPAVAQLKQPEEAAAFCREQGKIILKPLCGSGSELLFVCSTPLEALAAFSVIRQRLKEMEGDRLYADQRSGAVALEPSRLIVAEEFVEGIEFSCDFLIKGAELTMIRVARKWLKPDQAPGTIMAYQLPGELPPFLPLAKLRQQLFSAARALGVDQAICMADLIVSEERIMLLELTPRPGGDCLPPLLRAACGVDSIGLALDAARGCPLQLPAAEQQRQLVGLRLFAPRPGVIVSIDTTSLENDPRVLEVELVRHPGDQILFPPVAYASRVLGHAVFQPCDAKQVQQESLELLDTLVVQYLGEESV